VTVGELRAKRKHMENSTVLLCGPKSNENRQAVKNTQKHKKLMSLHTHGVITPSSGMLILKLMEPIPRRGSYSSSSSITGLAVGEPASRSSPGGMLKLISIAATGASVTRVGFKVGISVTGANVGETVSTSTGEGVGAAVSPPSGMSMLIGKLVIGTERLPFSGTASL